MSGVVRPPTVFVQNKIIAQRHFNAVAFAKFLREKVGDEKLLGNEVKQQTRLAAFLPVDSRKGIPSDWLKLFLADLHLDFSVWIDLQTEDDIFQTDSGKTLLKTLDDFTEATSESKEIYDKVLSEIAKELDSLMDERKTLFGLGKDSSDVDRSVKNLLDSDVIAVLAKRGFLPRYAFPLDVVRLETGWSRWSTDSDVDLSRERAVAIAEFAPAAQVIAHKKVFTSAGLYVASKSDRPTRKWYAKCPDCEQIRTSLTQEPLEGDCEVCSRTITTQYIKPFVEPTAFSIRMEKDKSSKHRRTSLVRQRQSLTHFIDAVRDDEFEQFGSFEIALKKGDGNLFRYNLGPQNKGFMLCSTCGCSEPLLHFKKGKKHKRLRAFDGKFDCQNENPWTKPLAFGHIFQSYCLIIRPREKCPVESLAMTLRKGLCRFLDLETSDIGTAWRWQADRRAEIILFDNTPGGAGFVRDAIENWEEVVRAALAICQNCTCETACYECLKDYNNQSQHDALNRKSVIEFLSA